MDSGKRSGMETPTQERHDMNLVEYVSTPLVDKEIRFFSPQLTKEHIGINHAIKVIPKDFTLIDALTYIFDNDPNGVANVLQAYQDDIPDARNLISALEDGIKNKQLCLTCIRNSMKIMRNMR